MNEVRVGAYRSRISCRFCTFISSTFRINLSLLFLEEEQIRASTRISWRLLLVLTWSIIGLLFPDYVVVNCAINILRESQIIWTSTKSGYKTTCPWNQKCAPILYENWRRLEEDRDQSLLEISSLHSIFMRRETTFAVRCKYIH